MTNEILNGSVVVFMGNKAGLFSNDLSVSINNALIAKSTGVPIQLAQNGTEFNFDLGLRVYNFGTAIQSSITVNALITNPSGAIIYDENVGPFSLNGVTGVTRHNGRLDRDSQGMSPPFHSRLRLHFTNDKNQTVVVL